MSKAIRMAKDGSGLFDLPPFEWFGDADSVAGKRVSHFGLLILSNPFDGTSWTMPLKTPFLEFCVL